MSDPAVLLGRKALVTGGTKGIGEAVAARLREGGATVLTTEFRDIVPAAGAPPPKRLDSRSRQEVSKHQECGTNERRGR